MSNPNIKFVRAAEFPTNITPQEGFIWFNSANNTIQLYKNGAWEIYTGKINDVTYIDGVLTITPHTGNPVSVNLGNVANIEGLANRLGALETSFNTLSGEFNTEKGKIATLEGTVGTHTQAIATVIGKLEGVQETVVKEIAKETTAREAADSAFNTRVGAVETSVATNTGDITTLKGLVGETAVATQITNAINALDNNGVTGTGSYVDVTVTQVDGKVTTVAVADGDLTTAFNDVNKAISDETTRATAKEGELAGAINTQKGRIDTLVGSDSGSVRDIAIDVLTETLVKDDATEAYDTLQKVSEWIKNHPESAATMNQSISDNTSAISGLTSRVGDLEKIDHNAYKAADTALETKITTAYQAADTATLNSAKAYTDELQEKVDENTAAVAANTEAIGTINGQITEINTVIEENELTIASALTDLDTRVTVLTEGTVKSVEGQNYVKATTTEGAVVVKATTGAVANGADGLALASDVKTYVDTCIASSWE